MADLKKVCRLVEEDKIRPAIIRLETFIDKVKTDISKGDIPESEGKDLINEATHLLNLVKT